MRTKLGLFLIATAVSLVGCAEGLPNMEDQSPTGSVSNPFGSSGDLPQGQSPPLPPAPPVASEFHWSHSGIIAGKTCVQFSDAGDPYGWDNNYLCTDRNFGLTWKDGQPLVAGTTCTPINENAGLPAWADNYLCAPSDLGIRYSSAGPITGMTCLQIDEPMEPLAYTWNDNYLCLPQ